MKKNKEDNSLYIPQRDKIKDKIEIKNLEWTPKQKEFIKLALDKNTKVIFVTGPAGSSKTILSVYCALELLNQRRISDILYLRSAVESADNKLGFLPGELDDKMFNYGIPFIDKLEELLKKNDIASLKNEKRFNIMPVNYLRGQSWNAKFVIGDEIQNCTEKEIYTILTRVGKFSKCLLLADPEQSDINGRSGYIKMRNNFCDKEGNDHGIFSFEFGEEDIMRDELTKFLVKKYKLINQRPTGS